MASFVVFLDHWQTLIGSFIGATVGGIVGLLAALLVANKEREHDENACATLLIGNLTIFIGAVSELMENVPEKDISTDIGKIIIADRFSRLRPTLSPMFDASMIRVMPVNPKLADHLHGFKMLHDGITQILDRLFLQFQASNLCELSNNMYAMADANKLIQGLDLAKKQAEYALQLLRDLFKKD